MSTLKEYGARTISGALCGAEIPAAQLFKYVSDQEKGLTLAGNKERMCDGMYDKAAREEFLGSYARLSEMSRGELSMREFNEASDAMGQVTREVETQLAFLNPTRKRRFSEFDGDFDLTRRGDDFPLVETYKTHNGVARVLDIQVLFQFSCGRRKGDILRFGALAFGIVSAIEKAGIQVNLKVGQKAEGLAKKHPNTWISNFALVKHAGEYLEPSLLARCFTTEFYRRCLFSMDIAACDMENLVVDDGLGSPKSIPSSATRGVLTLAPDFLGAHDDYTTSLDVNKLLGFIRTALGITASGEVLPEMHIAKPEEPIESVFSRWEYPDPDPIPPPQKAPRAKPVAFPAELSQYKKGDTARVTYGPESGKSGTIFWAGFSQKGTPRVGVRIDGRNVFLNAKQIEVAI